MSQIEEDARRFLQRIVWSVFGGLFWLITNLGIGMYFGLIVPEGGIHIRNWVFYGWMLTSLVVLIWVNIRIWKEKFPHG